MQNDLHPILRTFRLIHRASRTQIGMTIIDGSVFLLFCVLAIYLLTLACVGLHGYEACFN